MDVPPEPAPSLASSAWNRGEAAYAIALFVAAAGAVSLAIASRGTILPNHGADEALFFLLYGIFTISIGYQHPKQGYYSFDRVSQVASILVFGPLDAAWINGLASLIYPWHRLWKGVPLHRVAYASLNNSGLMTLTILGSGYLYTTLGGDVPLLGITGFSAASLVLLLLTMQLLNDAGMLGLLWVGRRSFDGFFNAFSYALELGAGATAVLVAVVYNTLDTGVFVLLLAVISLGMLALQRFAKLRQKLERLVEERTKRLWEKTQELEEQAIRDNLTGLFNRRYADRYLAAQLEAAKTLDQPLTVALADIDLFKQINDRHSHATGDKVLRHVAGILRDRCRKTDIVARYGGEEFVLCFPQTDLRSAEALCEQLRAAIATTNWSQYGVGIGVTISFGIAEHWPGSSPDTLLDRADRLLYRAKHDGRNRVVA
jgi:diguanylate cyclase (GGDEF)-like protein